MAHGMSAAQDRLAAASDRLVRRNPSARAAARMAGLDPTQCVVMSAWGESMEPTLLDSYSIMVNRDQTRRRLGVSTSCGREESGSEACGQGRGRRLGVGERSSRLEAYSLAPLTPRCRARRSGWPKRCKRLIGQTGIIADGLARSSSTVTLV